MGKFHSLLVSPYGAACLLVAVVVAGCSLLFPPRLQRVVHLAPIVPQNTPGYIVENGVIRYQIEGLRIDVEPVPDRALNEEFPVVPALGEPSVTPYTNGSYTDPAVGYTRSRFTVFRVTVHNLGLAKVELRPTRCLLTTARGARLPAYGILSGSATKTLESYFRSRQGSSGNDHYSFTQAMAIVRSHNYLSDEPVHRGESYGGYIVFDPLDDDIDEVELHLRDFVLRANAYGKPLQTIDLIFPFRRQVTIESYEEQRVQGRAQSENFRARR